ncbi:ferritin-like domain-containing protein [Alistipes sp.]|uniref:YciE/YciF ferroxidase family protein n=1 Tax=Alistipes sp. TaxID=1872444 RepID=UPI003A86F5D6
MKASKQPKAESARFREFFIDQIKDIYWAEKHLSAALKKMQKAATSPRLAEAFANHIVESEGQLRRLDKVFELLGKKPQAKKCDAMEGLISEAESVIEDTQSDTFTRDAGLILAAQKAEHYEIASYGTLRYYAELMGETQISRELAATLKEEKDTDSLLTCLTEEGVRETVAAE